MGENEVPTSARDGAAAPAPETRKRASVPWRTVTMYLRDGTAFSQARVPGEMLGAKLVRHRGMLFQWEPSIDGYVERQVFDAPENRRGLA